MLSRRGFLGLLAAPAIVRAASLMPVKMLAAEPLVLGPDMTAHEVLLRYEEYARRLSAPPLIVRAHVIRGDESFFEIKLRPGSINRAPQAQPLLLGEPMTEFRSFG